MKKAIPPKTLPTKLKMSYEEKLSTLIREAQLPLGRFMDIARDFYEIPESLDELMNPDNLPDDGYEEHCDECEELITVENPRLTCRHCDFICCEFGMEDGYCPNCDKRVDPK